MVFRFLLLYFLFFPIFRVVVVVFHFVPFVMGDETLLPCLINCNYPCSCTCTYRSNEGESIVR